MAVIRTLLLSLIIATSSQALARSGMDPFSKTIKVEGSGSWSIGEGEASQSAKASDGDWYHLHYDGMRLRLRVTNSSQDSDAAARHFEAFAVNDVKIDGKRVDVFQWCLNNQTRHSRFLEQGQSVKKDICENQGDKGSFVMRLTKDTIEQLNAGKTLVFELKPFRTTIEASYSLAGFNAVNTAFREQRGVIQVAAQPQPVSAPANVSVAAVTAPKPVKKCIEKAPAGYSDIKPIEYNCNDAGAKAAAAKAMMASVSTAKEKQQREAALLAKQQHEAEAARLARQKELEREQAAIAASKAKQAELSSEITKKMISVCHKNWAAGEHRCYCEKYIEFAPAGISSDPACASGG